MNEKELYSILLKAYNRWWLSGTVDDSLPYKRSDFYPLLEKLDKPLPLLLIGARQVGKTTIMKQLIEELLKKGIPKENILYIDLGDYGIRKNSDDPLLDTIKVYQQNVLKKDFFDSKNVYLFLDEVQKINGWNEFAKNIYDAYKGKVKLVLSGSSSLSIVDLSEESLAGRYELQAIVPMKFSQAFMFSRFERAQINKVSDPSSLEKTIEQNEQIRKIRSELRNGLEESLKAKDPKIFFEKLKKVSIELTMYDTELAGFYNEYLIKGGYPEVVLTKEYGACDRLLQTYVSDIITKDLTGKIKDPDKLEGLLYLLACNSGRKIAVDRICNEASIQKPTYYSYIYSLEKICLLYELNRLPTSLYGKQSGLSKIYINDVGLRNSLARKLGPFILSENTGELQETVICDHLLRLSFRWNNHTKPEVYYWSNKKEQEVDFVINAQNFGVYLPIEAKSDKPGALKGMKDFLKNENAPFGLVATTGRLDFDEKEKIIFIPIVYLLLLC
jgi:hypothetical protein